jgi:hypothetical protein
METDPQSGIPDGGADACTEPNIEIVGSALNPFNGRGLLSFDVGIVNLAYCLLRVDGGALAGGAGASSATEKKKRGKSATKTAEPAPSTPQASCVISAWDILCLAEDGEKAKRIPLERLGSRLFQRLDALWERHHSHIDTVLIENQPSRLNGHMKSIQMMIYTYFLYKQTPTRPLEVRLINASGKLKTHLAAAAQLPETKKVGYQWNKWASIQITDYYLRNDPVWKESLSKHKKKDDLCDAFLQGLAWFHKTAHCELTEVFYKSLE